jgi:anaphase-promoting complex subunit 3
MYLSAFFFSLLSVGTQMAQSRYLFAISCFQMDLLNEAEAALCPTNEPGLEVPIETLN